MKNLLLGALCIVVMSAAGFGGYTYYENQKQEQMDPWIKANLAALADLEKPTQGEGTPVASCARRAGPIGKYGERFFCDSRTSSSMIYNCPTSISKDYYIENNMDRCTK